MGGCKTRVLWLCLCLAGCKDVLGIDDPVGFVDGGGGGSGSGTDSGGGGGPGISGPIASDQTWSSYVHIVGPTTILPGVRVTITAGTDVVFDPTSAIDVQGTLEAHGTLFAPVILEASGGFFGGIAVEGKLTLTYTIQHGGGITLLPGSSTVITDSLMYHASGDFLIIGGGSLSMTYSQIGAPPTELDTTHCNLHVGGGGGITLNLTHNLFVGAPYNLMLYGGTNSILTSNNWMCGVGGCPSHVDIDTQPGVVANVSNSFFERGTPTIGAGANVTMQNLATIPLLDVGVRQTP